MSDEFGLAPTLTCSVNHFIHIYNHIRLEIRTASSSLISAFISHSFLSSFLSVKYNLAFISRLRLLFLNAIAPSVKTPVVRFTWKMKSFESQIYSYSFEFTCRDSQFGWIKDKKVKGERCLWRHVITKSTHSHTHTHRLELNGTV